MEFPLNKDQQKAFNAIEGTLDNYLIHGKPGVGKSVLIRALTEDGNKSYTLAAPTGLAALNIGGRTLHSIFRLPTSNGIMPEDYNVFPNDDRVLNFIRYQIKHLIIDEISMVRADMFDYVDRLMRYAKQQPDKPFGGAQVIIIGDFYQLPPVVTREEVVPLRMAGFSSPFVFSSKVFQSCFKTLFLDEVLRQKGDPDFIDLLNSARTGEVHPQQLKTINKQVGLPDDIRIKLAGTNKQADEINWSELRAIQAEEKKYQSSKFGEWPALPAEELLTLKVGAQVMVKMNGADRPPSLRGEFVSGVVNGTLGKVVKFLEKLPRSKTNYSVGDLVEDMLDGIEIETTGGIEAVVIEKDNGEQATIYRKRWERKVKEKIGDKWEEKVVASYEQIPLALAWAISIHKSQGQSFDKVHIDATKIFAPGQLYVALSRGRSLAGISLQVPVTTSKIWANRDVLQFFDTLENDYVYTVMDVDQGNNVSIIEQTTVPPAGVKKRKRKITK